MTDEPTQRSYPFRFSVSTARTESVKEIQENTETARALGLGVADDCFLIMKIKIKIL